MTRHKVIRECETREYVISTCDINMTLHSKLHAKAYTVHMSHQTFHKLLCIKMACLLYEILKFKFIKMMTNSGKPYALQH